MTSKCGLDTFFLLEIFGKVPVLMALECILCLEAYVTTMTHICRDWRLFVMISGWQFFGSSGISFENIDAA